MIGHREIFRHLINLPLIHGGSPGSLSVNRTPLHGHIDLAGAHCNRRSAQRLDGLRRNLPIPAQLQPFEILRFLQWTLVVAELHITVIHPDQRMNPFALHLTRQRTAQTAVHGASYRIIAVQKERHVEHVERRHDRRPHRGGIKPHIQPAGHNGIVHALIRIKLASRIGCNLYRTA